MRDLILDAAILSFKEISARWNPAKIPDDRVRKEPNKLRRPEGDHVSFKLMVMGDEVDGTPDSTQADRVYEQEEHTVQIECFGPEAWNWLHDYLRRLKHAESIAFIKAKGFTITPNSGIVDISTTVGADIQVRGTTTIRVACLTVTDRVIVEATGFTVGVVLDRSDLADNNDSAIRFNVE